MKFTFTLREMLTYGSMAAMAAVLIYEHYEISTLSDYIGQLGHMLQMLSSVGR